MASQYFVSPVSLISYKDKELQIPMALGDSGYYTHKLKTWISDIMYGTEKHHWGVTVVEVADLL